MSHNTDDLRIREIKELSPPAHIMRELVCTPEVSANVYGARHAIHNILNGLDDRLAVIIGPCSIHNPVAALDYARHLVAQRDRFKDDLEIIMRVYFEKPRTTVGWKGLINDPTLDGCFNINQGLRTARQVLIDVNRLGLPAGCEFLDMITPQYIADLVSWGAIGARTTESQVHRELASGLSCPVGFKNGTDGNVKITVDAINAASHSHHFLSVTKGGRSAIVCTVGNDDCHAILRGGKEPNYDAANVDLACQRLSKAGLRERIMIDASHSNSHKDYRNQPLVVEDVAGQIEGGDTRIFGIMVESNLIDGRQDLVVGKPLVYGQSITDGCIGWESSVKVLERLSEAVKNRRKVIAQSAAAVSDRAA